MEIAETNGLVTVQVDCQPQYDAANGLITAVAKCTTDGICQAAACDGSRCTPLPESFCD